jgi:hypothetical protein
MEAKARRQRLLLAALVVVLAAALWWSFGSAGGGSLAPPSSTRARPTGPAGVGGRRGDAAAAVEPVALEVLQSPAPEPTVTGRNPFRFQSRAAAAPPDDDASTRPHTAPGTAPIVQGPTGPPPPPPIPLRFIGTVDELSRHLKLAVLSDGRNVFYGREGDIIEGRYRIVRIGVESIEMIHVDGRGPQTIRLTGS